MTKPNHDIRRQVLAAMIEVGAAAEAAGKDAYKAIKATFPGTPDGVAIMACVEIDSAAEERWWQSVERTVDIEIAQRAIAKAGEA